MKMGRKNTTGIPSWFYGMISLFCMNLFGRGSIVCFLFAAITLGSIAFRWHRLRFDRNMIWIVLFSIVCFFVSWIYFDLVEAVKCLNFVLLYIIGVNEFEIAQDKERFMKSAGFAIFAGYAIYVILTFYTNLTLVTIKGQRVIVDFWRKEYVAVTMVGLLSSVIIGYFFYALMVHKHIMLKLMTWASMVVALLINIETATRTPIILFGIMAVIMRCIYLFDQRGKKALKTVAKILLLMIALICIYIFDVFHVRSYIESTPLYARFMVQGISTGRTEIMKIHFRKAFNYPWGGGQIEKNTGYMAHNYIQQCYDLYGVLATLLLVFISAGFVKNIVKLIGIHGKKDVDYLFISMYMVMLLQALLEPVYTGYPCFMYTLFLIHGIGSAYLSCKK